MQANVTILETNFEVTYDFKITASGCGESWSAYGGDPAEPAEYDLEIIELRVEKQADDVHLDIPTWLEDLLLTHLYERDDINEIVQRADQERGSDYED